MARRMSNKDRIAKAAAEAKATESDKKAKKATKKKATKKAAKKTAKKKATKKKAKKTRKKTTRRKAAAPPVRMKLVWEVCQPTRKPLKVYPYPQRAEADAEAARLTEKHGSEHFVRAERVPMEIESPEGDEEE